MKTIAIIGGGISGLATAIELIKQEFQIFLIEKHSYTKDVKNNFLTFNLTINYRGKDALERLGLWDEVKVLSVPLHSRMLHHNSQDSEQLYSGNAEHVLYAIPRSDLLNILFNKANSIPNIQIMQNTEVKKVEILANKVSLTYAEENSIFSNEFDFLVGTDGANSFVRNVFKNHFNAEVNTFSWGYIDFCCSQYSSKLKKELKANSLHIWPEENFMCVGIPNLNNTISLLYLSEIAVVNCKSQFQEFMRNARRNISNVIGDIEELSLLDKCDKIGQFKSVKTSNWYIKDKIILLGDSAHAIWPFYGQGMNAALQDACTLSDLLEKHTVEHAFHQFYKIRKPCTDILSELSEKHFFRLKDKSQTIMYNAAYKLDLDLSYRFPKFWLHEYSALSNTCINITKIYKKLKRQAWVKLNPIYLLLYIIYLVKEIKNSLGQ